MTEAGAEIAEPRAEMSPWAPRIVSIKIDPERIGTVIGKGGETIKAVGRAAREELAQANRLGSLGQIVAGAFGLRAGLAGAARRSA